jgi:pSer/pThr/pTyr-binding forkhead associated (FHA) protein
MIKCPSCESQSYEGAFFCNDCGAALIEVSDRSTDTQKQPLGPSGQEGLRFDGTEFDALATEARLGLRVMITGEVISLHGRDNFTLGQSVSGQAVVPDVDLSGFDAEAHGISRIHAELRAEGPHIMAIDLDSFNGTQLNGNSLEPKEPVRVHHGDMLQLGTLQLQLLIR